MVEKERFALRVTIECMHCLEPLFTWEQLNKLRFLLNTQPGNCPHCGQNTWTLVIRKSDLADSFIRGQVTSLDG